MGSLLGQSPTGDKVDNRRQSRQQAGKSRTGDKADNRRGQYIKPPKSRTGVEPRTGGHLQPAHSTPEVVRQDGGAPAGGLLAGTLEQFEEVGQGGLGLTGRQ